MSRYESRLHRISHRAHQTFLDLRRAVASGLLAPPAAQAKPEPPSDFQNPATGDRVAAPPEAEPTPDPQHAAETEQAKKPAAAPARPIAHRGQKKFKNEPTIRRVLRRIRNHRALNTAFRRSKKGPAPAGNQQLTTNN